MERKRLAIDFDGVLCDPNAEFTNIWTITGQPLPGAIEWLKAILESGQWDIMILTARLAGEPHYRQSVVTQALEQWLVLHGLTQHEAEGIIFTGEKHGAHLYIDDHGWRFDGRYPPVEELAATRAWWKKDDEE